MFTAPSTPALFVGWVVLWWTMASLCAGLVKVVHNEWRRRRRVRYRMVAPRRCVRRVDAPHWTRDPSPRRRLSDYEYRALSDGSEQT